MRQVGYLQELYRDARSTKHKIMQCCNVVVNTRTQRNIYSDSLCWSLCFTFYCYKGRYGAASDTIFKNAWKSQYPHILLISLMKITQATVKITRLLPNNSFD